MGNLSKPAKSKTKTTSSADSLFAKPKAADPVLAALFANSGQQPQSAPQQQPRKRANANVNGSTVKAKSRGPTAAPVEDESSDIEAKSEASSSSSEESGSDSDDEQSEAGSSASDASEAQVSLMSDNEEEQLKPVELEATTPNEKSRRKRKRDDDELESRYMEQLAREEAREETKRTQERESKRQKAGTSTDGAQSADEETPADNDEDDEDISEQGSEQEAERDAIEVPKHESLMRLEDADMEKANRTVFLGNVSSEAVTSKVAKKALVQHMSSILESLPTESKPHRVESLRFRSTAYTNMLPKKASFVTHDLMETTTKTTNAYVVYSTKVAARAALKLNGTVVLKRHLRVDSIAHPAKNEPRRCVFVGNLGFVDDANAVNAAAAEENNAKKKPRKSAPSDIEEGLWREFGKCGTVENVRVIRDSKTRVGKGFAYVQFTDENSVESALLLDGKHFPPMLPRKLRISRAKAIKRNATLKRDIESKNPNKVGIYRPKISSQQLSDLGRASRMLGKAGAALMSKQDKKKSHGPPARTAAPSQVVKAPESFVFEGHRAKSGSYTGNKKKAASKKSGRPKNRSSKRAAAWKSGGKGD